MQGSLLLTWGINHMNLLQKSAKAWKEIIEYRYLFVYGYKKQLHPINLIFSLNEYPHLAGFQYAKDIALPNYSSAKIADRIIEGKISFDTLKKATQYEDMIKPRLEALIHLKESLDNEFNLYSFMPRMYPFYTTIKADYLISSHTNINNFIFIINRIKLLLRTHISSEFILKSKCSLYLVKFLNKKRRKCINTFSSFFIINMKV